VGKGLTGDPSEGRIHETSVAAIILTTNITRNKLLFRESCPSADVQIILNGVSSFKGTSGADLCFII
jgi:hypothetical protein